MQPPRFFYGWVIVGLAFISLGFAYGVWYSFSVFFVAVVRDFGLSRANAALAFSVFVMVHGISSPIIGGLVERCGVRRVVIAGSIFFAASLAACSVVTEAWQYYITFGVLTSIGVTSAGVVTNYVAVNRWFIKRRGLVMGIASAGVGLLGLSVLVPLNQYLISNFGWRSAYLVLAIIVGLLLPALDYFFQRERPQDMGLLPDGLPMLSVQPETAPQLAPNIEHREWTVRMALCSGRFWAVCGVQVGAAIGLQTVIVHEVAYFTDLGRSAFVAATVVGLFGLVSIPLKVLWGGISDRLGREVVYSLGGAMSVIGLVVLAILPGLQGDWPLYLFAVFFGGGYAAHTVLAPTIVGDIFMGKRFPVIYGLVLISNAVGSAIGPYLAGYIFDVGGSYAPAFVISALSVVVAVVSIWIAAPRREWRLAKRLAVASPTR